MLSKTELDVREPMQQTHVKKCGCNFEVVITKQALNDFWCTTVKSGGHNHSPSQDPSVHPSLRRKDRVEHLSLIAN